MSQQDLLIRVVELLDAEGVAYMLTGSFASSIHGEPRSSHDIDFVVALEPSAAPRLVAAFPPPEFYLDEDAIRRAVAKRGMFNLIHVREGDKVDFWVLKDAPFDRVRFARRREETAFGRRIWVSRPEDTIAQKLSSPMGGGAPLPAGVNPAGTLPVARQRGPAPATALRAEQVRTSPAPPCARWSKKSGGSEQQVRDAVGVYEVQRPTLDQAMLDDAAAQLGVADLLARVRAEAEEM